MKLVYVFMKKSKPYKPGKSKYQKASVKRKPKSPHGRAGSHQHLGLSADSKKIKVIDKKGLHERNLHRNGYDFERLIEASPALKKFVRPNPYGKLSIDFTHAQAVKALNFALLKSDYQIEFWDIPQGFLCPPIPGRVDYIHYLADLLAGNIQEPSNDGSDGQSIPVLDHVNRVPTGPKVKALDIGTGANGIYPILGIQTYGWSFAATDVDPLSITNVQAIIDGNQSLKRKFKTRLQTDPQKVFVGIIQPEDRFDVTLCNPPFHSSLAQASDGSKRKLSNLAANRAAKGHKIESVRSSEKQSSRDLNFGGQKSELWCEGGEKQFLLTMISESKDFATQCLWFTSLVSKKDSLKPCYAALEKAGAVNIKTIEMVQGNKLTRVLAWSYLTPKQQALWAKYRW
jgi:23S rRNA (adenine1618-N6)-methyltransferase